MSQTRTLKDRLRQLLGDDDELYVRLCEEGLLPREDDALRSEHLETARVVHTLVHELEVNWAGVEVVLHMRTQLVATQRQVAELAKVLRDMQTREE